MLAYMVGGSEMHLRAAKNAFTMLLEQSFAVAGDPMRNCARPAAAKSMQASATPTPALKPLAAATPTSS
jgi:hypothetical protein